MIKRSDLTANVYKPKDVAAMMGVTTKTLREWDAQNPIFEVTNCIFQFGLKLCKNIRLILCQRMKLVLMR